MSAINAHTDNSSEQSHMWEDQFLSWFGTQNIPMLERKLSLDGIEYIHFWSSFPVADGRTSSSYGSHQNRRTAALKCAAEAIERKIMVEYFSNRPNELPRALQNSNGWAVHSSSERAIEKAEAEALERHLLLKSFCKFGWAGFRLVQSIDSKDMSLKFLVSRFKSQEKVSGMIIAQSPKFKGISIGYTAGILAAIGTSDFWQGALFEAVDKLLVLEASDGIDNSESDEKQSWIRRENDRFLSEPFDLESLKFSNEDFIETEIGSYATEVIDIGLSRGLGFPLYAAYVHGGNLIPLFWKPELDPQGFNYVLTLLQKNDIDEIPEWHPVL